MVHLMVREIGVLQELFGPEANHFMIVLFTRGGDLGGMTIQQYVSEGERGLRRIIQSCGNRFHVFDNTSSDKRQVVELVKMIDKMVAANKGTYYTDEMYKEVEEARRKGVTLAQYRFTQSLVKRIKVFRIILGRD
ncbi:GTPase IMAP family member 7-like [Archocentrus centrarchus]|uniref:GTPase IMAP family member 7-like n=1 Tax=Archocentrus centrarchus TaxID=63155 RepID=UPI0011EA308C|nr:GTPase IMAP family member 7-like [Archocentrus centrarchus]